MRHGRHLKEAERFLAANRPLLVQTTLVFASVNLTARKPGQDTAEGIRIRGNP
jgi:menaquinone-dependent protoporphyrinogen oxidase